MEFGTDETGFVGAGGGCHSDCKSLEILRKTELSKERM